PGPARLPEARGQLLVAHPGGDPQVVAVDGIVVPQELARHLVRNGWPLAADWLGLLRQQSLRLGAALPPRPRARQALVGVLEGVARPGGSDAAAQPPGHRP